MTNPLMTTITIPRKLHKRLKRAAEKSESKLMPFSSAVITAGLEAIAKEPEPSKP